MNNYKNGRRQIMVFSSNLSGIHGAGSAKAARFEHGAQLGVGVGFTGNAYAIPTKSKEHPEFRHDYKRRFDILPLNEIEGYVKDFIEVADKHPELDFHVVPIGCGLAGYSPAQIAPMFKDAPENVYLPDGWRTA